LQKHDEKEELVERSIRMSHQTSSLKQQLTFSIRLLFIQ